MIRASEAETYEMMRAGHDLVMKMGIQEAFEASNLVGAAAGSESGIHKAAPIVIHDGQVAQDLARRQTQSGAQLIGAKFQPQILCFASANRTLGFARNRIETAASLVFVNAAPEQIRQGARDLRLAEVGDNFGLGNRRGLLKTGSGHAVLNMGAGRGKRCKRAIQNIAAPMRETQPAMAARGDGADRLNAILFALEPDDAEGRAHARNFGDEQSAHVTTPAGLRRGFAGFWGDTMR